MDWRHCWEHTNSLNFLSILKLTLWLIFGILTRWLLKREHFQPFSNAWNESENRKLKKLWKKERRRRRREKTPNVHLILSHVNHTFWILNPPIGPQAFRHTRCTLRIFIYFLCEEGSNSRFNLLSNWSLGFWSLDPLSKVALKVLLPLFLCVCVCVCACGRLRLVLSFLFLYEFVIV